MKTFLRIACALLAMNTPNVLAKERQRNMLGGYSTAEVDGTQVLEAANFVLTELVLGNAPSDKYVWFDRDLLGAENGVNDDLRVDVVEAEQQVVAGLNLRLSLAVSESGNCLGAFGVTVYNHFGVLSVTNWGMERSCESAMMVIAERKALEEPGI